MKLETFFEKFELFADVPNAVGKMRELVLQLAVQGSLVPHSPAEAAVPYASIKDATPINVSSVPVNWRVVLLADAVKNRSGNSKLIKGKLHEAPAPHLFQGFSASGADVWCDDYEHEGKAIIISAVGARCGKAFKASGKWSAIANTNIARPEPALFDFDFAYLVLNDERFWVRGGSAQPFVKFPPSLDRNFAIPPLAEQKRIVAKVDELMALCDRLVAQQQERDTRHAALARASLARFAEAPTPANLDFLFHKSYRIIPADLRKTILTLAVQGKLVTQEPADGDARDMIDRAMEMRQQTIRTKSLRRKELDESTDLIGREDLPSSWCVERFANLVDPENTISYGVLVPGNDVPDGIPFVRAQDLSLSNHPSRPNKTIAPEIEKPYSRTRLTGGEILLCVVGSIGKLGIVPDSWAGANIARAVARIKPIPEVLRDYLLLVLQEEAVQTYFTSTTRTLAQPTLNVGMIEQTPIPVPPLAEQRRIVAKVDQLMALVDRLETQLSEARIKSAALLDAVIHELLNPTAEIIDLASYRAAVGCYAIGKMQGKRYFGRTAAMKVLYLAQAHVGLELGLKPMREAAGPFDSWLYRFEEQGEREAWFKVVDDTTAGGKKKIEYRPGRALAEQSAQAERLFTVDQRKELDRLLALFSDRTTEEAEIIATLFAAWNDFLIDGHEPSDDEIVREVRENWHEKKGRFTPALLRKWLGWLRQNDVVPKGRTPRTMHQTQLLLN